MIYVNLIFKENGLGEFLWKFFMMVWKGKGREEEVFERGIYVGV